MSEIRMIVFIVKDDMKPGGLDVMTVLVTGDEDFAKRSVNRLLERETRRVVGWKLTDVLPVKPLFDNGVSVE